MENSRNKQHTALKLHAGSSEEISHHPSHPIWKWFIPLPSISGLPPISHLVAALVTSACISLFYLIMAPKHQSMDAGNSDMPKRSCSVLPLSEKVHDLNLLGRRKRGTSGIWERRQGSLARGGHEVAGREWFYFIVLFPEARYKRNSKPIPDGECTSNELENMP